MMRQPTSRLNIARGTKCNREHNQVTLDSDTAIVVQGCLAQSGNSVSFRADGSVGVRLDLPQTEIDNAARLARLGEVALFISFVIDSESTVLRRHGGRREGAGRKPSGE